MLNIDDTGQSVTSEALDQLSLSDFLTAAAPTAKPAPYASPLEAALDLIERGLGVCPFSPDATRTAIKSPTAAKIIPDKAFARQWFAKHPADNVGVSTDDGLLVVRMPAFKRGDGALNCSAETLTAFRRLKADGLPDTAQASVPNEDTHYYYRLPPGVQVRGGRHRLGTDIHVYGVGSIVLAPGSKVDGVACRWRNSLPIADAPDWLIERCGRIEPPQPQTAPRINSHQTEDNMPAHDASNSEAPVQAATKSAAATPNTNLSLWGQEAPLPESKSAAVVKADEWIFSEDSPNAEGDGQYDTAISVAVRVCGFGVNREEAVELLSDWNALACTPGLCPADIRSAVQTAYSDRQRDGSAEPTPGEARAACVPPPSKLEAALDAARRGFSVFPLKHYVPPAEDTAEAREHAIKEAKKPVIGFDNWQYRATTDKRQIREWWTRYPNANIGGVTHGLLVVDVDPKNGGDATYAEMKLLNDFPDTLRTKTPSGGNHNIYALPPHVDVGNSPPGALGPGIDIKSAISYIVLPGSTYEERLYEWANDTPSALAPQWLIAACKKPRPKGANAGKRVVEEDDTSIELAKKYLTHRAPEAHEGTRNNTAVIVANGFYDYAVSKETCVELLWQWNETHCFPPLGDAAELEQVAASAPGSRIKPIGCSHPLAPGFTDESESMKPLTPVQQERQEIWKAQLEREAPHAAPLGCLATPLRRFDPATLSPVPWIVRGLTARRAISILTGPGGVSKSTWTLMLAVAAATGRSDICGYAMLKRERAWVWSQEDDIDQMELRVAAIMQAFGVSHDDLLDESGRPMLYLNSGLGKGKRLNLAKRSGENIVDGEHMADMLASAKAIGASLVILDPLITLHQASENDNVQMRAVFDIISQIAVEANCAVLIVSHTGKPDKGSSKGFAGDLYAGRGASAQPDAARVAVTFMGMSESDTKLWNVPAGLSHADFVRIDDSKSNLGRKRREPRWFRREAVTLQGFAGDDMEVLRPVEMVAKVKEGRPDLLHAIARAIANSLPAGEPHGVAAIAPHLPGGEATALQGRNRARTINEAFGGEGINEYLTDFGTLRRSKGVGNRGTLFALTPATHAPQIVSE